jgi:lipid-A-disaccharide synthase-like uncharacterized protein
VSGWRLIGFAGTALFGLRWLVQCWRSRRAGTSVVTPAFWLISLVGSALLLLYFAAGPHADPVGMAGNALPMATALYNLALLRRRTT